MLTNEELARFKRMIDEAARPIIFFDTDPDGTSSFLQVWRYKGDGKGIPVRHNLNVHSLRKVEEYGADLVIALDIPLIDEEFLEQLRTPLLWLDHHEPIEVKQKNITYMNPRIESKEDNRPTSHWTYKALQKDLWLGALGTLGDWSISDVTQEFAKAHPEMLDPAVKDPATALFTSELGKLVRMVSFNLRGRPSDVMTSIKVMSRLDGAHELLNHDTARGKYLFKRYERVLREYTDYLEQAKHTNPEGRLLVFQYSEQNFAVSSDLSNELLYLFPEKIVLVCREYKDVMICSMRTHVSLYEKEHLAARDLLNEALIGTGGTGGGHLHAIGANVPIDAFPQFVERLKELVNTK